MAPLEHTAYLNALKVNFRDYLKGRFPPEVIDLKRGGGLVFAKGHEKLTLVGSGLGSFIPPESRHRWFRSLASACALGPWNIGRTSSR